MPLIFDVCRVSIPSSLYLCLTSGAFIQAEAEGLEPPKPFQAQPISSRCLHPASSLPFVSSSKEACDDGLYCLMMIAPLTTYYRRTILGEILLCFLHLRLGGSLSSSVLG
jgi:hypothetical protein